MRRAGEIRRIEKRGRPLSRRERDGSGIKLESSFPNRPPDAASDTSQKRDLRSKEEGGKDREIVKEIDCSKCCLDAAAAFSLSWSPAFVTSNDPTFAPFIKGVECSGAHRDGDGSNF
jgi:hypothetical protein